VLVLDPIGPGGRVDFAGTHSVAIDANECLTHRRRHVPAVAADIDAGALAKQIGDTLPLLPQPVLRKRRRQAAVRRHHLAKVLPAWTPPLCPTAVSPASATTGGFPSDWPLALAVMTACCRALSAIRQQEASKSVDMHLGPPPEHLILADLMSRVSECLVMVAPGPQMTQIPFLLL
jgi:hypothetical protein